MNNRTKLQVVEGWPGKQVEYISTYKDGSTQKCLCSVEEWRVWEIQQYMITWGIDEKLVEELYDLGYSIGHEAAEMDHAEQDAGESL
jgi:hypothetical protein